jgi:hypothetical protein
LLAEAGNPNANPITGSLAGIGLVAATHDIDI